ncbi:MAG: polysaccharide deacetylase family protein [Candidatus Dormibacteria bacterium]
MSSPVLRPVTAVTGPLLILGIATLLAACGPPPPYQRIAASGVPSHRVVPLSQRLETSAASFMRQFETSDYAAQWSELAPPAQAQWPSEAARNSMLAGKFTGSAQVVSYSLGTVQPAAPWVSPEDPAERVSGGYQIPVKVEFTRPAQLAPAGVASFYQSLRLVLLSQAQAAPTVLGEGPASLDAPIIDPTAPGQHSAPVPILMYHVVAPFPLRPQWNSQYAYDLEYGLTVTPGQFSAQMANLASAGAHAISLTRLADFLDYGLSLPSKPVVITFDDGRESPFQNAVPVLQRYGYTATFFVPSGLVGRFVTTETHTNPQHYMSWTQIDQLASTGFWIEDHTLYDNVALWGLSTALVQQLAGQTAATLEQHTSVAVQFIAYSGPWPFPTAAQAGPAERQLFTQLGRLGYVGGAVDARTNSSSQNSAGIWQLPRVRMNPNETPQGLAPWIG